MEVVGNEVYNAVMRNQWFESNYWTGGARRTGGTSGATSWWATRSTTATVSASTCSRWTARPWRNRIDNCVSANLFVSSSRNVTLNRNWIYANTDRYNRPTSATAPRGSQLGNEATSRLVAPNVRLTNNIVEWVSQGLRYWRPGRADRPDTYGNLYVGFNNFNRTQSRPCASTLRTRRADRARVSAPDLVINASGYTWFATNDWTAWQSLATGTTQRNVADEPGHPGHLGHLHFRPTSSGRARDPLDRRSVVRLRDAVDGLPVPEPGPERLEHPRRDQRRPPLRSDRRKARRVGRGFRAVAQRSIGPPGPRLQSEPSHPVGCTAWSRCTETVHKDSWPLCVVLSRLQESRGGELDAMGKLVGLGAALFSLASLAAGADGSWSWCSQTSRLNPIRRGARSTSRPGE